MSADFELVEIEVCQNIPPPDPMWSLLISCCRELLNTAITEFRLCCSNFDDMVLSRGSLLECMRDVMCLSGNRRLQHPFDAADETLALISEFETLVLVPSTRTEAENKHLLKLISARMLCALYYYIIKRPLVQVDKNLYLQ